MKLKAFTLILLTGFVLFGNAGIETLSANPKKDKKKKMKKSEMIEAISEYEAKIEELNKEIEELKSENESLKDEVEYAKLKAAEQETKAQQAMSKASPYLSDRMPTEVYFKVQLGAYKKLDIKNSFNKAKTLETEVGSDGVRKYIVADFDDLQSAKKFEADLKKLGIKDTWLVPYKNKRRISDEEASELVGKDIRK